jgi:hypothetical protein
MSGRDVNGRRSVRIALIALAAAGWCALAASEPVAPSGRPVTEVRFEVIDPPVVYQKDITQSFATSNNPQSVPKPIEFAGMAFVDGRLLIVSDRHEHCVFASAFNLADMTAGEVRQHVIVPAESSLLQDAEAITIRARPDGAFAAYVMCSLSNHRTEQTLPMRRHMARFTFPAGEKFSPSRATVIDASPIREALDKHFDTLGVKRYSTFFETDGAGKNTYRWGNVEGIAFTPDGTRLLCGLRNPLTHGNAGHAILYIVENVDAAFDKEDANQLRVTDLFTLDLGDRGISDLCWDPMTKGYLIAAAKSNGPKLDKDHPFPPNTLDSALFWWSGRKKERPILFATVPQMKIEAIARLGGTRFIAIGSDEGDESEGREQRQSVITVMDFTGFK